MDKAFSPPAPDTAELARLVAAVAEARDKTAFAALYAYFAPRLKTYLMRLGANAAAAEDLAQEAMFILWRKAETFDPRQANVRTWMFTIARNKRIDALRREKRPELDPNDPALVPEAPIAADSAFEALEHEDVLREAIATLPEEQASLLRVCYYEDKSHRQIARELDIPLGTVKSRLRLALARLRVALQDRV
ncbi:MAG: sigma-70 family RNA polymerase sigma factor [Alphaproteobacteria bacterium]